MKLSRFVRWMTLGSSATLLLWSASVADDGSGKESVHGETIEHVGLFEILKNPEKYDGKLISTEGIVVVTGKHRAFLAMSLDGIWSYSPDVLIELRIGPSVLMPEGGVRGAHGKRAIVSGRVSSCSGSKRDIWAKLQMEVHAMIVRGSEEE